jgi:hypothetical protein
VSAFQSALRAISQWKWALPEATALFPFTGLRASHSGGGGVASEGVEHQCRSLHIAARIAAIWHRMRARLRHNVEGGGEQVLGDDSAALRKMGTVDQSSL